MALADKLTLVPSAQYGVVYGRFVQGVGGPSLVSGVDENPDAALSPVPGLRITFKPSTDLMISDPATQDSFAPTAYNAYTDGDGFFEISLLATDLKDSSVENWFWEAEVYSQNPGNRSFRMGSTASLKGLEVKANQAVWLGDIITEQDASGNYVMQGKSAYEFAVDGGYEGTEGEFATALNASLDFPGVTTTMLNDGLASKADVGHVHPRLTLTGTGFPEGRVTAEPGTQYFDTARTCGATLWLKELGTGSSGWRLLKGDTGWRNIMSYINQDRFEPSYAAPHCWMRRVNDEVYFSMRIQLKSIDGITSQDAPVPETLIPTAVLQCAPAHKYNGVGFVSLGDVPHEIGTYSNGVDIYIRGNRVAAGIQYGIRDSISSSFSYTTYQGWPSTLPGTPA